MKNNKGITLIALIITIVVILILVVPSVKIAFGEGGIFKWAKKGVDEYNNQVKKEQEITVDILDVETNYAFAINLVNSITGDIVVDAGGASLSIYSDVECKNLVKQIVFSEEHSNGENTYTSSEGLQKGTYYISMNVAPIGYAVPTEVFVRTVDNEKKNTVWDIEISELVSLPSSGPQNMFGGIDEITYDEYGEIEMHLKKQVHGNEFIDGAMEFSAEIYELGTYNKETDEYQYRSELLGKNLHKLSKEIIELGNLDVTSRSREIIDQVEEIAISNLNPIDTIMLNSYTIEVQKEKFYLVRFSEENDGTYKYTAQSMIVTPELCCNENGKMYGIIGIFPSYRFSHLFGDLEIISNLEKGNYAGYPVAIYSVNAKLNETLIYSNVFSTMLFQNNQEAIIVNDLPASSEATINLIYTSPNCIVTTNSTSTAVIEANEYGMASAGFSFANNGVTAKTIGITNLNFTYNSEENVLEVKEESGIGDNPIKIEISGDIHATIENNENSNKFVRMKVLGMQSVLTLSDEGGRWRIGEDGYYYYSEILASNATCSELNIHASLDNMEDINFNVIIVVESTDVKYDSEGNPYADWTENVNAVE